MENEILEDLDSLDKIVQEAKQKPLPTLKEYGKKLKFESDNTLYERIVDCLEKLRLGRI